VIKGIDKTTTPLKIIMSDIPLMQQVRLDSPRIYRRLVIYIDLPISQLLHQLSGIRRELRGDDILQLSICRIAGDHGCSYVRLSTRYIWLYLLNENQQRIYSDIARSVNNYRLLTPSRPRRSLRTTLEQIQTTVQRNSFLAVPTQNNLTPDQDAREILNSDLFDGSPQQFCFFGPDSSPD
ncbi:2248_t:CDS:1, partial [Acaulospora colombiana]